MSAGRDEINRCLRRAAGRLPAEESSEPAPPSPGGVDAGAGGEDKPPAVDMNQLLRDGARRGLAGED